MSGLVAELRGWLADCLLLWALRLDPERVARIVAEPSEGAERFHGRVADDLRVWLARETTAASDDRWCAGAEDAVERALDALTSDRLRDDPDDAIYRAVLAAMELRQRLDEEGKP